MAAAAGIYLKGREYSEELAAVMSQVTESGIDVGAAFPANALQSVVWMWYGGAVGVLFQGFVFGAILFALASITESLIGIRISSRVTAQAALGIRSTTARA